MKNNKFNDFSLSEDEVLKILNDFENTIKSSSIILGKYNEDCAQEIRIQIYKSLTKNSKNKKNLKNL